MQSEQVVDGCENPSWQSEQIVDETDRVENDDGKREEFAEKDGDASEEDDADDDDADAATDDDNEVNDAKAPEWLGLENRYSSRFVEK